MSMGNIRQRSRQDACFLARLATDYRGQNTVVLDLTAVTPLVDFFVITTGTNPRQMRALAEEARQQMKKRGHGAPGIEGEGDNSWLLIDFGDIVLHVFNEDARDIYNLEDLWGDATLVDWEVECSEAEL